MTRGDRRPKVAVVTWSVNHNPIGRAHVLAELLSHDFDVELVGFEFPAFPAGIWEPLRTSRIPVRSYAGTNFPAQLDLMEVVGRNLDADAVVVSKPRVPGFGVGVFAKATQGVPLIVDVDDLELSFVGVDDGVDVGDVEAIAVDPTLHEPHGRIWTQVCDGLVRHTDGCTVSNHTLADRFGGTVIPHARDEHLFDPQRVDREAARAEFGIDPGVRLVLFGGTPRRHKGVVDLAGAIADLGDPSVQLCVIGTPELRELRRDIEDRGCGLVAIPPQPFDRMPMVLAAADVTAVLQDGSSPISRHQMPAKVTDALAMQVPCVVNQVPPLDPLIEGGHLEVVGEDGLGPTLERILGTYDEAKRRAVANRDLFLSRYSHSAVAPDLCNMVWRLLDEPPPMRVELRELLVLQRRLFPSATPDLAERGSEETTATNPRPLRPRHRPRGGAFDLVVFWKQNDSGLYGRRADMFAEELARSAAVGRVIQFDAPLGVEALRTMGQCGALDQSRLVFETTIRRVLGQEHAEDVRRYTFLYDDRGDRLDLPRRDQYLDFVQEVLDEQRRGERDLVFWVYPTNSDLPALIDRFMPHVVVADIVDDNRTWFPVGSDAYDRLTENYREVLGRSEVALANCEPVREAMRPFHHAVELVPNACEPDGGLLDDSRPRELEGLHGPIVGYVGNLSSRIDIPLIERMAVDRPDWNIVLIGSTHAGSEILTVARHPNVSVLGPRRYEEAKQFINAFDVAMIPHLDNEMTQSMNPLKAFVYCSLGVPVVSTELANLDVLGGLVTVASTADDFIASVDKAVSAERRPITAEQRRMLELNSWKVRADRAIALIDEARRARP